MALYEIRTMLTPSRASLISHGDFSSDFAAISTARALMRRGEGLDVWREGNLVYRIVPSVERNAPPLKIRRFRPKSYQLS